MNGFSNLSYNNLKDSKNVQDNEKVALDAQTKNTSMNK